MASVARAMTDIEPGIYFDIPEHAYNHEEPWTSMLRRGDLVAFSDSPKLCAWKRDHPSQTPAMTLGTAIHAAVLEPTVYDNDYAVAPKCVRNRREGGVTLEEWKAAKRGTEKAWEKHEEGWAKFQADNPGVGGKETWERFEAETPGKKRLSQEDGATVAGVAREVRAHPIASLLMDPSVGYTEVTIAWKDRFGTLCKARFDKLIRSANQWTIVDLKSAADAGHYGVRRAWNSGQLWLQASFYRQGLSRLGTLGLLPPTMGSGAADFSFVFFQKTPPYLVRIVRTSPGARRMAGSECDRLQGLYSECLKTGVWSDRSDFIDEIGIPSYMLDEAYEAEKTTPDYDKEDPF